MGWMTILQEKNYQRLLDEVSQMYESTLVIGVEAQKQYRVKTFLHIGQKVVGAEAEAGSKGRYGANVSKRLSADLTRKYGKGFKRRTVDYICDFARNYDEESLCPTLYWNHYKALLSIEDVKVRKEAEQRIVNEALSVEAAKQLVRRFRRMSDSTADAASLLTVRNARKGLAKVVVDEFDRRSVFLDVGFFVQVAMRVPRLHDFTTGEMVDVRGATVEGGRARGELRRVEAARGERYCFDGTVLHVVDGDTLQVRVKLWGGSFSTVKVRLRGVAAAELGTSAGEAARVFVGELAAPGTAVTLYTYSQDRYGRWVGDVMVGKGAGSCFLNVELIASGCADFLDMGKGLRY